MSGWTEPRSLLLILAASLALGGCQPSTPEALLDDYVERLARVTGGTAGLPAAQPGPAYPSRRALRLEITANTIDVAEFVELHGCDMGALVGFRNSPLGRLQTASQRLGYEMAWLRAAERCGEDAAGWLAALGADKRSGLPALFWNATFGAAEMRTALGSAAAPAGDDLADIVRGLNDSLRRVQQGGFDLVRFERSLGRLNQGSWAGPARADWSRWRRYLTRASALLHQATPGICLNRQPTPDARILRTVFRTFYVGRIQPELARGMRRHQAWIVELERLAGGLAAVRPHAFEAWFHTVLSPAAPDSEWRRTRQAVVDHARAWQALFAYCGIEPGLGLGQH